MWTLRLSYREALSPSAESTRTGQASTDLKSTSISSSMSNYQEQESQLFCPKHGMNPCTDINFWTLQGNVLKWPWTLKAGRKVE